MLKSVIKPIGYARSLVRYRVASLDVSKKTTFVNAHVVFTGIVVGEENFHKIVRLDENAVCNLLGNSPHVFQKHASISSISDMNVESVALLNALQFIKNTPINSISDINDSIDTAVICTKMENMCKEHVRQYRLLENMSKEQTKQYNLLERVDETVNHMSNTMFINSVFRLLFVVTVVVALKS